MTYNELNVNMGLKRIEICDLLIACTMMAEGSGAEKWSELHDKLAGILDKFDSENLEA